MICLRSPNEPGAFMVIKHSGPWLEQYQFSPKRGNFATLLVTLSTCSEPKRYIYWKLKVYDDGIRLCICTYMVINIFNPECSSVRQGLKLLLPVLIVYFTNAIVSLHGRDSRKRLLQGSVSVGLCSRTGRDEGKRSGFQTPCDGNLMFIWFVSVLLDVQHDNMTWGEILHLEI